MEEREKKKIRTTWCAYICISISPMVANFDINTSFWGANNIWHLHRLANKNWPIVHVLVFDYVKLYYLFGFSNRALLMRSRNMHFATYTFFGGLSSMRNLDNFCFCAGRTYITATADWVEAIAKVCFLRKNDLIKSTMTRPVSTYATIKWEA